MDSGIIGGPTIKLTVTGNGVFGQFCSTLFYNRRSGSLYLWYTVMVLICTAVSQFVNMGLIETQAYYGIVPHGWSCYNYSADSSPPLCSTTAWNAVNVSSKDLFICYKVYNVTLDSISELQGALGNIFSIYLLSVAFLDVIFKLFVNYCSTRLEDHPDQSPTRHASILVLILAPILYSIASVLLFAVAEMKRAIYQSLLILLPTIVVQTFILGFLIGCLHYRLDKSDIEEI
jgi:hypothetical protein